MFTSNVIERIRICGWVVKDCPNYICKTVNLKIIYKQELCNDLSARHPVLMPALQQHYADVEPGENDVRIW